MVAVTKIPKSQHAEWHAAIAKLCDSFGIVGDGRHELTHWFDRPRDEAPAAHLDRALDLIEQLVALVPVTSMASHAAQESLHAANALLAESGRGQPDRFVESTLAWAAKQEGR